MSKKVTGVFIFLLIASLFVAGSALASHEGPFDTGRDFGEHIFEHALESHFGGDENPGVQHQGFFPWAPGN
ncbi:MAG: hypothetical protein A2Z52_01070 [Candidatus Moranbacteria bacterium RBG_19FT_COMBO_42_6]|nr:MAG: hypothetical protein A2Z52_01070 [Candidatus Moranbacteria bacterium RBG_19FT_COMBO_42_6]